MEEFDFSGMAGPTIYGWGGPQRIPGGSRYGRFFGRGLRNRYGRGGGGYGFAARRFREEGQQKQDLKSQVNSVQAQREGYAENRQRSFGATMMANQRGIADLKRNAAMVSEQNQPVPANFAGALGLATRRARVRVGIARRGEAAVENQAIKDRIAMTQAHVQRQGVLQAQLGQAANIQQGVDVGAQQAKDRASAAKYNAIGTVVGAGFSALKEWKDGQGTGVQPVQASTGPGSQWTDHTAPGTGASDFMRQQQQQQQLGTDFLAGGNWGSSYYNPSV